MINGRNFFNQKSDNDLRTNFQLVKEIITQLAVYQIIFNFKKHFKLNAIDLNKQHVLDFEPKESQ